VIRAADKWLPGYLASAWSRPRVPEGTVHVMVCMADHFEPFQRSIAPDGTISGGRPRDEAATLVREWCAGHRESVAGVEDSDGVPPRHTFFYPQDEYDEECVDILAGLCREGFGEIEVQVHHRNDTADGLRIKLEEYRDVLHERHGVLGEDAGGKARYGFVHGNWCLCNSRPDGDWCGVNEELTVLAGTGCYADFTFPSAPSPTQPRTVNTIYRAVDRAGRPRGHDQGEPVTAGQGPELPDSHTPTPPAPHTPAPLLLIPGPLALDWRRRKFGVLPRLDTAAITGMNPPSPGRVDLWLRQHIHVRGRPEWVFLKAHTHGCVPENRTVLFGEAMRGMHRHVGERAECFVHYVTAREMHNIIRAAEDGNAGNPGDFRDYEIARPVGR